MRKLITIILLLWAGIAQAQTYQLNYDSIRVGKTAGTGSTSMYGKVYLKNVSLGLTSDSILVVRNGRIFKVLKTNGTVTSVAKGFGLIADGTITTTGTVAVDSAVMRTVANSRTLAETQTALNLKANLASPTFTGIPAAPTAAALTNTTQVATTAFVTTAVAGATIGLSAIGATPNANGATITGSTLNLQPASASFGGVVTTGTQTLAGSKTFSSDLSVNGLTVGLGAGNNSDNTAIGRNALLSNTTGTSNTTIGKGALQSNTTGSNNTANGFGSLQLNSTGGSNTANGVAALNANTTGSFNTANGALALGGNTTGSNNTANGGSALGGNTTGSNNTANGGSALGVNSTGSDNTAFGLSALASNTTGFENTAIGRSAGVGSGAFPNTTGSNNTYVGFQTRGNASTNTNETVIGSTAVGNGSNTMTFGNTSVTNNYFTGSISSTPQGTLYGTATGSITSAQLATSLTNETGTGVAVFATSPTLVTPVLGNATGGTLGLSGALTGTSATFSAGISATTGAFSGDVTSNSGSTSSIKLTFASSNYAQILDKDNFPRIWFETVGNFRTLLDIRNGGSIQLRDNNGNIKVTFLNSGNVGIGTTSPATSGLLDLTSTTGALILTRMTTAQRDALTAVNGMILYNSTLNKVQVYENGAWVSVI